MVADILAKVCTYNKRLEEGLHASPILSNLHCYDLDLELVKLAHRKKCSYSRYADDIAFSSGYGVPSTTLIGTLFKKYNFVMNKSKTRYSKQGQAQYVTGLSVSDNKYPRAPRPIKRKLRTELHYIKKYGAANHFYKIGIEEESIVMEICRIEGWIKYISGIEPVVGSKYQLIFDEYLS